MSEHSEFRRPSAEKPKKSIDVLVDLKNRFQDTLNALPQEAQEQRQALTQQFLVELEEKKEAFPHMFQTEKGSWYFVTPEGHSLRFRAENGLYEVKRPMHRVVYTSEKSATAIMHALKRFGGYELDRVLVGRRIASVPLQVGAVPLEFGLAQNHIVMDEGIGAVRPLGTERWNEGEGTFEADTRKGLRQVQPGEAFLDTRNINGFHIGHAITAIKR